MVQRFCLVSLTISNIKTSYRSNPAGSTSCPWTTILVKAFCHIGHVTWMVSPYFVSYTPVSFTWNLVSTGPVAFEEMSYIVNMYVLGQRAKNDLGLLYLQIFRFSLRQLYIPILRQNLQNFYEIVCSGIFPYLTLP